MELDTIVCSDALQLLRGLPDKSVDLVLTDPPYGYEKTNTAWDSNSAPLDYDAFIAECLRVTKKRAAICVFGAPPFSAHMTIAGGKHYRYSWFMEKQIGANFGHTDLQPFRVVEEIMVFSKSIASKNQHTTADDCMIYHPPKEKRDKPYSYEQKAHHKNVVTASLASHVHNKQLITLTVDDITPRNLLKSDMMNEPERGLHSTQKPRSICEFLIETYTNEGDLVVDCYSGSGTTAAACLATGRHFIVGDTDPHYCEVARHRLQHTSKNELKAALAGKPTTQPMFTSEQQPITKSGFKAARGLFADTWDGEPAEVTIRRLRDGE
jgi:site-specific DNA-methyltransferase (adenine-specific)